MLLWDVKAWRVLLEKSPNVASDIPFEDADCIPFALSPGNSFLDEVLGSFFVNHASEDDAVERTVSLAIPRKIKSMFGVKSA